MYGPSLDDCIPVHNVKEIPSDLFLLLYHNRQRPVSYMQSTGKKPQDNNGGGDAEGYGGI